MSWAAAIFLGLLTGAMAAIYAGFVADLSVPWLRISTFEGGAGYFVLAMGLLGLVGGALAGVVIGRVLGGPGGDGALRGFGYAVLIVGGIITAAGGWAWMQRDVAPEIAGGPIDLALELRLPRGMEPGEHAYAYLRSGPRGRSGGGSLDRGAARREDGRWILPGRVSVTTSEGDRRIVAGEVGASAWSFPIPLPARPAALEDAFGPWIAAADATGSDGPPELRYRVVRRPPPAPPPPPEPSEEARRRADFAALPADAPTAALLGFVNAIWQDEVAAAALRAAQARSDFLAALAARAASPDHDAARDALYVIGAMRPAPAELADVVRAGAAEVSRIAEAIDPSAADSRDRLYAEAHTLSTGVVAAAFGLRRAGIDISPELRAMAAACRPREKAPPHAIADAAERVAAYVSQAAPAGL
ncbi:hypothetical protein GWK16_17700 [Roseomonas sp. JC162]|uniref:Uncharacterized protein n=1 Tax=Neoroseomonas marina TaxID=1232220 RepID=A0A848EI68_9PROT|nr:hypothetical protein [Neoroseomonas marina]NMJ43088.1 hypothetical protein [Neoroseomonas marina]